MNNTFYIKNISKEQLKIILQNEGVILEDDFEDGSVNINCRDENTADIISNELDDMKLEFELI